MSECLIQYWFSIRFSTHRRGVCLVYGYVCVCVYRVRVRDMHNEGEQWRALILGPISVLTRCSFRNRILGSELMSKSLNELLQHCIYLPIVLKHHLILQNTPEMVLSFHYQLYIFSFSVLLCLCIEDFPVVSVVSYRTSLF